VETNGWTDRWTLPIALSSRLTRSGGTFSHQCIIRIRPPMKHQCTDHHYCPRSMSHRPLCFLSPWNLTNDLYLWMRPRHGQGEPLRTFIHSFIHRHTPRSVAVLATSRQWALLDAMRRAEFSPKFGGLRSFSTVRSQEVAGQPGRRLHSGEGLRSAAATTLWWSSLGEARARWPKYCNHPYLTSPIDPHML